MDPTRLLPRSLNMVTVPPSQSRPNQEQGALVSFQLVLLFQASPPVELKKSTSA